MHKVEPKTYFIDTFGCQMNVSDSEVVESILKKEGCVKASRIEKADMVFVNTCSIRDHAEKKVHSQLRRYAKLKIANKNLNLEMNEDNGDQGIGVKILSKLKNDVFHEK